MRKTYLEWVEIVNNLAYDEVLVDMLSDWQADGLFRTDCINKLEARIAELEAERRWIPVSERLPDTKILYDKFDVIVELGDIENGGTTRCVELMSYDYRNKSWNDDCGEYGFYPVAGVTHWRERPTLPEVQK